MTEICARNWILSAKHEKFMPLHQEGVKNLCLFPFAIQKYPESVCGDWATKDTLPEILLRLWTAPQVSTKGRQT